MHTYAVYKIKLLLRCGSNVFIYLQFDDCIFCNGYCMIIICYVFIYRCQSIVTASLKITALTLPCYALGFYRRCTSWFLCLEKKNLKGNVVLLFTAYWKTLKQSGTWKAIYFIRVVLTGGRGGTKYILFLYIYLQAKLKFDKREMLKIYFLDSKEVVWGIK